MARDRGTVKLFDRGFDSLDELKARCHAETGHAPPAQPQFNSRTLKHEKSALKKSVAT